MILIVGLGNPGKKYEKTRHNVGFMVVDELARKFQISNFKFQINKKANAEVIKTNFGEEEIVLAKPQTFMNASGFAVSSISQYLNISISDIWVIHDDVDIPLGKIKIRFGGAAAGHHGVESIIRELGTDKFLRFRLGIGHPRRRLASPEAYSLASKRCGGGRAGRGVDALVEKYVLREFDINEKTELKHMLKQTVLAIEVALKDGVEKAMNRFNR